MLIKHEHRTVFMTVGFNLISGSRTSDVSAENVDMNIGKGIKNILCYVYLSYTNRTIRNYSSKSFT